MSEHDTPRDAAGAKLCAWCGATLTQPATGRSRDYCSRSHREYAYRQRRQDRLIAEAVERARLTAYTRGKRDAESWAAVSSTDVSGRRRVSSTDGTDTPVDETSPPAHPFSPVASGGGWVRSAEEIETQLRDLERKSRQPDGRPQRDPHG